MTRADGGQSVLSHLPPNVHLISHVHPNGALYEPASPKKEKRKGPARKKGDRLPGMKQWADDPDRPWTKLKFNQFGLHATLEVKTIQALYYKAGKDRLLTIVLTRDLEGKRPDQMFYCTKLDWTPRQILSAYACRWAIECTFENCKQFLGLEDPANRLPKAVARTAPMALFIYSLVVVWFDRVGSSVPPIPRPTVVHKTQARTVVRRHADDLEAGQLRGENPEPLLAEPSGAKKPGSPRSPSFSAARGEGSLRPRDPRLSVRLRQPIRWREFHPPGCSWYAFKSAKLELRTLLEKQRDNLLAFAVQLDRELAALAQEWQISVTTAREVLQVQSLPTWDPKRWRREAALRETLRGRYHGVCADVQELSDRVVRASSLVENLNSRLRAYFFLRRQLGKDYLTLLQFFLNHRWYLRSEDPSRVGKSPAELLTGEPHAHWLELLGYTRFSRN